MESNDTYASHRLSRMQAVIMGICGVILWLAAAMLLRWLIPLGALEGTARYVVYALTIPGTVPFVLGLTRIAGLSTAQLVPGYSLATAAALLCDGMAVAWVPVLYGASADHVRLAAAAILWGAGVGIALAFATAHRMHRS